jgi:hypothetical protein
MKDIALLCRETKPHDVLEKFPHVESLFFVSNGPGPLQGRRFRNVYIDYICYKDPHYEECIQVLLGSILLTKDAGQIILF